MRSEKFLFGRTVLRIVGEGSGVDVFGMGPPQSL